MNDRDQAIVGEAVLLYRKLVLMQRDVADGIVSLGKLVAALDGSLVKEYVRLTTEIDEAASATDAAPRSAFKAAVNTAGRQ